MSESSRADSARKALLGAWDRLDPASRRSLVDYAEFLAARATPCPLPDPQLIPRPEGERVVAAVKRLTRSYPMVDRSRLLGETSRLMAAHLMEGRAAAEVIDELEALFAKEYSRLLAEQPTAPPLD